MAQERQRQRRLYDDGIGASDKETTRGGMAGGTRRRVAIKNDGVNLSKIIFNLVDANCFNNYLHSRRVGQIVVVGVNEPERDDDVEIPSGILGGLLHRRRRRVASTRGGVAGTTAAHE
jgi:hypothetical protein